MDGRFFDEGQNGLSLGTGCISGCAISEGDSLILIKYPGRFGAGSNGEGWERNTNNSQIGIFLRNSYRTKAFFYIIDSKIFSAPGTDEDAGEFGNNSRSWFGDLVEAEASLCTHLLSF